MELQDVKQFLNDNVENEDVKSYLGELTAVSEDKVKGFLDTEEGKKLLQPRLDSYFTKGLDTWKGNNLQKLIDEEVSKRNPSETPEQKRIRELEEKIAKSESERTRETLKNKALSVASDKKLPTQLIDFLIGNDEDTTNSNLAKLEEVWNSQLQALVDEKLKNSGTNPGDGGKPNELSKEEFMKLGYSERVKLQQENPELYKKLTR